MDKVIDEKRKNKILSLLNEDFYKPMRINELANFLEVPKKDIDIFKDMIHLLICEGEIVLTKKNKLVLPKTINLLKGIFQSNGKGYGFVIIDGNSKNDIFIPSAFTKGALNKDIVFCRIISKSFKDKLEGEIVSILKRGNKFVVGTFEKFKNFGFVKLDDPKVSVNIFISNKNSMGAMTGHKVVVKIIKYFKNYKKPEGKIIEILGYKNHPGVDILSIVKQYNLSLDFSKEIYNEIKNIDYTIKDDDLKTRIDLRDVKMITIDPDDAKDLDDAVSLRILSNKNYELGVHISDVSHYVKENTYLDKEAFERGRSVYLPDRVIPMLPHELSNGICSLNENVDRLALSCIMEINNIGDVISHKVIETVINVDKKMSYDEVNEILELKNYSDKMGIKDFIEMLNNMKILSKILKTKRENRGSLEFDFQESKIILDDKGNPIDIKICEKNIATNIIEEFMIVCNETIAEEYFWLDFPFVFRCHEKPDSEKLKKLSEFISYFNYNFNRNSIHSKYIQNIMLNFKSKSEKILINKIILRSLKQAKYTSENIGHFGLASKYYCHFTSPIRRYPDLQIHRIIKDNINFKLSESKIKHYNNIVNEVSEHSSITERVAEEVDRESVNLKKVQYMQNKIGEVFLGIISNIKSWGIYVELENTIEGMVSVSDMIDDYYIFDEQKLSFIGKNFKNTYCLGDKVFVKLVKANVDIRKLDFIFVENEE